MDHAVVAKQAFDVRFKDPAKELCKTNQSQPNKLNILID